MKIIVDQLVEGYIHACSLENIESLIRKVPEDDFRGLAFIVFHQPTHKEETSHPRWAAYVPNYKRGSIKGPAILLEAINSSKPLKWNNSLDPDDQKELERLEKEGHEITRGNKEITNIYKRICIKVSESNQPQNNGQRARTSIINRIC